MADIEEEHRGTENEEEYVMLNLDEVVDKVSIPPNAPYDLSGLDTLNPILIIDNRLKLIGEYDETIGTCYVFSEQGKLIVHGSDTFKAKSILFGGLNVMSYVPLDIFLSENKMVPMWFMKKRDHQKQTFSRVYA